MRMSFFETEKPSSEAGWLPRVAKNCFKKSLKKFLTKANEFDKINELLIERTAKKFERASKKLN